MHDYQPKKILTFKQILLITIIGFVWRKVKNVHTDVRV